MSLLKKFKSSCPQPSNSNSSPDVVYCELYFDRLPTEVLFEIVKFLTPVDISRFLKVCSRRCAEVAYAIKTILYDACRRVELEDVLVLFNSVCPTNIVEINFNNVCHISGSDLTSVIVKCEQLITLSVINCGISISNVVRILQQCKKIENVSWDVHFPAPANMLKNKDYAKGYYAPQLKNMFLLLIKMTGDAILSDICWIMNIMFSLCPEDVNIYLNYSSVPIFHPVRLCHAFQIKSGKIKKPLSCFSDSNNRYEKFLTRNYAASDGSSMNNIPLFFTEGLSYLQLTCSFVEADGSCWENYPISDIESLTIHLDFEHSLFHTATVIECLKSLKWPKLKNLSFQDDTNSHSENNHYGAENVDRAAFQVFPILSQFMLNVPNITTLNFSWIHVGPDLPINYISCLKRLTSISIPTCGMQCELSSGKRTEGEFAFLEVITNCTEVKHFSLQKCVVCSDGPGEEQLMHLKNWKKMMDLNVSNVPSLRVCRFLRAVADSCPDLRALHLTDLGHKNVCHYMQNVMYVLRKSKRLQLLRLNQEGFHLQTEMFWNAIKLVSNLECLCIASQSNSFPPVQRMLSAFTELKFLYMLHLTVKNLPQNFESRVRQVFRDHEVKTPQISLQVPTLTPLRCCSYHFGYPCFHDIVA